MMVERLFLAVPRGCLQFVIVVFPDHTHLLFFIAERKSKVLTYLIFYLRYYLSLIKFDLECSKD